jgi:hypothetical protein
MLKNTPVAPHCPTQIYFATDIKLVKFCLFHNKFKPKMNVSELQIHEGSSSISEHTTMKKAL